MDDAPLFHHSRRFRLQALGVIFIYCGLHLAVRLALPPTLGWDDAEQTLWAQELSWAYGLDQPPMYTWLVYATSAVFGPGPLATGLVRYVLLFTMYAGLLLSACALLRPRVQVILALGSYLLIYQYAFYSHHDLTHSTLASAAIAMTLFAFIAALRTHAWWSYALLGLAMGCGMMAKYNFAVFAISLFAAAWMVERYRPVFNRRLIPALALTAAICAPYYSQLVIADNADLVVGSAGSKQAESGSLRERFLVIPATAVATLGLPQPFAVIAVLFFPVLFRARCFVKPTADERRLLALQMICGLVLSAAGGLVMGLADIKPRWLFPALILLPFYLFSGLRPQDHHDRRIRGYLWTVLIITLAVLPGRFAETYIEVASSDKTRRTLPVVALGQPVQEMGFSEGALVGESNHVAGNLVMLFPDADVYSAVPAQGPGRKPDRSPALYVWRGPPLPIPDEIAAHAESVGMVIEHPEERMRSLAAPYPQNPQRTADFALGIAVRPGAAALHEGAATVPISDRGSRPPASELPAEPDGGDADHLTD